jgi:hypothetical protein
MSQLVPQPTLLASSSCANSPSFVRFTPPGAPISQTILLFLSSLSPTSSLPPPVASPPPKVSQIDLILGQLVPFTPLLTSSFSDISVGATPPGLMIVQTTLGTGAPSVRVRVLVTPVSEAP